MGKLRLIQAGVGGMGKSWRTQATGCSPDFELAGIVDVAEGALKEAGEALGVPEERRFRSLEAALDAVGADGVLTVTPPVVHAEHAKLAFSRGMHLLTEKPLADSLENARAMVRGAREAGKQLVVGQNYRYSNGAQRMKGVFGERPLGEFGHGHIDFYIPADFTGSFREGMEFPLLIDMAIHHIDLIRHVTGRNVVRVMARTFNPPWSWYKHHAGLKMMLELEGGIPFSYSGDWAARGRVTGWNGVWRLQCAEGSMHWDGDSITLERCERWGKNPTAEKAEVPALPVVGLAKLLANFAGAIRTNAPAETCGADNLWSFAAVMAAVQSAREGGRSVEVAPLVAG